MNKKIVAIILGIAVAGGIGTTAYASSLHSTNANNKSQVERAHKREGESTARNSRRDWIKEQLKAGKTVKEIKVGLESRFKTNIDNKIKDKKITAEKGTERINKYNADLEKANIFNGVVKSKTMKEALMQGKTLKEAEQALIKEKTTSIDKLVTEKKITSAEAKEKITKLTERIDRGEGIFVNHDYRRDAKRDIWVKEQLKSGKTVKEIKTGLESRFKTEIDARVKDKKITAEKGTEIINKYNAYIGKADIFNGVVRGRAAKEALMQGKTLKEAEQAYINERTTEINKLVTEKKITSTEAKERIEKLTENVNKGDGIFINHNYHKQEGHRETTNTSKKAN